MFDVVSVLVVMLTVEVASLVDVEGVIDIVSVVFVVVIVKVISWVIVVLATVLVARCGVQTVYDRLMVPIVSISVDVSDIVPLFVIIDILYAEVGSKSYICTIVLFVTVVMRASLDMKWSVLIGLAVVILLISGVFLVAVVLHDKLKELTMDNLLLSELSIKQIGLNMITSEIMKLDGYVNCPV